MQKYLLSVRNFNGAIAPVLIKGMGYGDNSWLPPSRVYLVSDVEAAVNALLESQEFHEALMDYRGASIRHSQPAFEAVQALVRNFLMVRGAE